MCGADRLSSSSARRSAGSSPRVRSRRGEHGAAFPDPGIISACAEQTTTYGMTNSSVGDHLRVCGADPESPRCRTALPGSSPRVRSRLVRPETTRGPAGIISACAEQTTAGDGDRETYPDHLRVCGADSDKQQRYRQHQGSSPRVRSRPWEGLNLPSNLRIISACAEQTPTPTPNKPNARDHLRVCGADMTYAKDCATGRGSSPRVRSRPTVRPRQARGHGIISACAEQTKRQTDS